jgi:hypothetical protein
MFPGTVRRVGLAGLVVAASALLGPVSAGAAGPVGITLRCYANPELTIVRNNTGSPIVIRSIKSQYRPQDFEPIEVGRTLGPGKAVTFQSGFGATQNILTKNFIYYDNEELDGTRIVTSVGIFKKRC